MLVRDAKRATHLMQGQTNKTNVLIDNRDRGEKTEKTNHVTERANMPYRQTPVFPAFFGPIVPLARKRSPFGHRSAGVRRFLDPRRAGGPWRSSVLARGGAICNRREQLRWGVLPTPESRGGIPTAGVGGCVVGEEGGRREAGGSRGGRFLPNGRLLFPCVSAVVAGVELLGAARAESKRIDTTHPSLRASIPSPPRTQQWHSRKSRSRPQWSKWTVTR